MMCCDESGFAAWPVETGRKGLLPCPHCGCAIIDIWEFEEEDEVNLETYYARCSGCPLDATFLIENGYYATPDKAAKAWNRAVAHCREWYEKAQRMDGPPPVTKDLSRYEKVLARRLGTEMPSASVWHECIR